MILYQIFTTPIYLAEEILCVKGHLSEDESTASSVLLCAKMSDMISENGVVSPPATAAATSKICREDLATAAEKMKKTRKAKTRHGHAKRER